jgi:Arm DNA-binding domain
VTDKKPRAKKREPDKHELTDAFVRNLKAPTDARVTYYLDTKVKGFGLAITDRGNKAYFLNRRVPPRNVATRLKIGDANELSLANARAKASKWVGIIADGKDPRIEAERERQEEVKKQDNTFQVIAEAFIADKLPGERKGGEVASDIRRELVPAWGRRPITDITNADVRAVVLAKKRTAPAQARNLLGIVKRMLGWTVEQGRYELTSNVAESIKAKKLIGKKRSRDRVLEDEELFALWRAVGRMTYPVRHVYQLLTLTGLRLNEAADAQRSELDPAVTRALRQQPPDWTSLKPEQLCWTIPAARMKGREEDARPHAVPLTSDILRILEELPRFKSGDYLFSTTWGKSPVWLGGKIKHRLDARMLRTLRALARRRGDDPAAVVLAPWVNHDIRRTVRSGLSRLKITEESREAVLAHRRPGIKGTYDRYDYFAEKREALEAWAARLRSIVEPPPSNVVPLRRSGS